MKDHEITAIDRLALMMVRQGKERSRALPQSAYSDPARTVKFESERTGMKRDIEDTAKADALLMEHYYWQKAWRPKLGLPGYAPECRESVSSRQWDSTVDITRESADRIDMESVDWCINEISAEFRQIIGCELRNRAANATVWSPTSKRTYTEAVAAIIPLMKKKNLL